MLIGAFLLQASFFLGTEAWWAEFLKWSACVAGATAVTVVTFLLVVTGFTFMTTKVFTNNSRVKESRRWAVVICLWLLPPLLCGAAQFVEISAEIELTGYRAGETNDAARANLTRTISLVCITGTNEWRIEHDYVRTIVDWRFREPTASVNGTLYTSTNAFAAPTNDPVLQDVFKKRVERAPSPPH